MEKNINGGSAWQRRLRGFASSVCAVALAAGLTPAAALAQPSADAGDPVDVGGAPQIAGDYDGGEILVQYDDAQVPGRASALSADYVSQSLERTLGATIAETVLDPTEAHGTVVRAEVPEGTTVSDAVARAEQLPGVSFAQPNYRYSLLENGPQADAAALVDAGALASATAPAADDDLITKYDDPDISDQYYLQDGWGDNGSVRGASVADAWNTATADHHVTIAVLDTGIRVDHEDLADNILMDYARDMYADTDPGTITTPENPTGDIDGHGSHVAGIAAGVAGNGKGIAGVSGNANIIPIKVFDNNKIQPGADTADIVQAYEYLNQIVHTEVPDLHVINMSLGGYGSMGPNDRLLEDQINTAEGNNILTVCAGGNGDAAGNPRIDPSYPSDYDAVMSVTALEQTGGNAHWSDYNEAKDISAPGVHILSSYNRSTDDYGYLDGTSMASPLVAGVAALMWAVNPNISVDAAKTAIYSTANKMDSSLPDYHDSTQTGSHGAIDAAAAAKYIETTYGGTDFKKIADCTIDPIADQAWYKNYRVHPWQVTVRDGDKVLKEGTDYVLRYRNDTNVGTATVVAVGKGDYTGALSATYQIKYDLSTGNNPSIVLSQSSYQLPEDGGAAVPEVLGVHNRPDMADTYMLEEGRDFTVAVRNNTAPGTGYVDVMGTGDYMGKRTLSFTVLPAPAPEKVFDDVAIDAWYARDVANAAKLGIVSGYTDEAGKPTGLFGPEDNVQRAQVAVILARLDGADLPDDDSAVKNETPFSDNADGQYYTASVNWAYENGILNGYAGTNEVNPTGNVTRQELAAMLANYAQKRGIDISKASDEKLLACLDHDAVASWAFESVTWATDVEIISGIDTPSGRLVAPDNNATRAEMAAMALRARGVYGIQ